MSRTEGTSTWKDWLAGGSALAASLALLALYASGQLHHTFRFLLEILVDLDRLLGP